MHVRVNATVIRLLASLCFASPSRAQFVIEKPTRTMLPLPDSGVLLAPVDYAPGSNASYGFRRVGPRGTVTPLASVRPESLIGGYVENDTLVAVSGGEAYSDFFGTLPVGLLFAPHDSLRVVRTPAQELSLFGGNYREGGVAPAGVEGVTASVYDSGVVLLDRDAREVARYPLGFAPAGPYPYRLVDARDGGTDVALRYVETGSALPKYVERALDGKIVREASLAGSYLGSARIDDQVNLYTDEAIYALPSLAITSYADSLHPIAGAYFTHDAGVIRRGDGALYEHRGGSDWRLVAPPHDCPPDALVVKRGEGYYAYYRQLLTFGHDRVEVPPVSAHALSVEVNSTTASLDTGLSNVGSDVYQYVVTYTATLSNFSDDTLKPGALRAGDFQYSPASEPPQQAARTFPSLLPGASATLIDTVTFPVFVPAGEAPRSVLFSTRVIELDGRLVNRACTAPTTVRTIEPTVSTTATELTGLVVSPSPASHVVYVELESGIQAVELYDFRGRLLLSRAGGGSPRVELIHGLPPGVYAIVVTQAGDWQRGVRRVIIQ